MSIPQSIANLRKRMAGLTGPDRATDCDIAVALDGFFVDGEKYGEPAYCYTDTGGGQVSPGQSGDQLVRRYTASLDAALALVERALGPDPYYAVERQNWRGGKFFAACAPANASPATMGRPDAPNASAQTAPLALISALLASLDPRP